MKKTYHKQCLLIALIILMLSGANSHIKAQSKFSAELSTLPVIGMFPKDGNVRYSSAEIRGEFLGATLNYQLFPFESYPNVEDPIKIDFSVSAHLLGVNWSQLFNNEEATLMDWGYLRAGISIPFSFSDGDGFFGRSNVRFQTGIGRVIINIPELTETGYQWGLDISFSFTYQLNE